MLFVMPNISSIATIACKFLQRQSMLFCDQCQTLARLVDEIRHKVGVLGPLPDSQRAATDAITHALFELGDYAVAFSEVFGFMEEIGAFFKDHLTAIDNVR